MITRYVFALTVLVVLNACGMGDDDKQGSTDEPEVLPPEEQPSEFTYYYGHYELQSNPATDAEREEFVIRVDIDGQQPHRLHLKQTAPTSAAAEEIALQCQQLIGYRCTGKDSRDYEFNFEFFAWDNTFELHNFWVTVSDDQHAWVEEHSNALTTTKIRETHFADTEASQSVTQMQEGDLFGKWTTDLCPHLQKGDTSYEYELKNDMCADRKFVFSARSKFVRFALKHKISCALDGNDFKLEFKASDNSHSVGCASNSLSIVDGDNYSKGAGGMGIEIGLADEHDLVDEATAQYLWVGQDGKWDGTATNKQELDNKIGTPIPSVMCLLGLCSPPW